MSVLRKLIASTALTIAAASAAYAAEPVSVVVAPVVVPPVAPPTMAAYVEARFGLSFEYFEEYYEGDFEFDEDDRLFMISGAGRAAFDLGALTLQLDAWHHQFIGEDDQNDGEGGLGLHAIYRTAGGLSVGALASIGQTYGLWANFAGEAARSFGNFRVAVQSGFVLGIFGEPAEDGERAVYGRLVGTFYPGPGFAISANVGIDRWWETTDEFDNDVEVELVFGGRIEKQIGGSPLSIFVAYQAEIGRGIDGENPAYTWIDREHVVAGGFRFLIGPDSLQAVDEAVGFADHNQMFGDLFGAH